MWKTVPLGALAESVDYGLTASAVLQPIGPKFLRITDIQNGSVNWDRVPWCECDLEAAANARLERGDIVFARTGATTGKSFLIRECPTDAVFASYLIRVRVGAAADPSFVGHFFRTPAYWTQVAKGARGVAQPGLNATTLKTLSIPLPPLRVQRRIAEILDRAEALRAKRHAAFSQLAKLAPAIFLEMFGEPVRNERRWPTTTVGNAGRVQLGRQRAPQYQSGKHSYPYVRVANVYENRIDLSDVLTMDFDEQDVETYRLVHGDILLNEGQSTELVGRPAMWRNEISACCFQNTLVRFQAECSRTLPEFALHLFLYYFRSGEFAKVSSKTSNVAHLGAGRFAMMPFILPPLALQQEFARQMLMVYKLEAAHLASLAEMDALFASLQQRAFSGQL